MPVWHMSKGFPAHRQKRRGTGTAIVKVCDLQHRCRLVTTCTGSGFQINPETQGGQVKICLSQSLHSTTPCANKSWWTLNAKVFSHSRGRGCVKKNGVAPTETNPHMNIAVWEPHEKIFGILILIVLVDEYLGVQHFNYVKFDFKLRC
jgi:hypothetical protein